MTAATILSNIEAYGKKALILGNLPTGNYKMSPVVGVVVNKDNGYAYNIMHYLEQQRELNRSMVEDLWKHYDVFKALTIYHVQPSNIIVSQPPLAYDPAYHREDSGEKMDYKGILLPLVAILLLATLLYFLNKHKI